MYVFNTFVTSMFEWTRLFSFNFLSLVNHFSIFGFDVLYLLLLLSIYKNKAMLYCEFT